MSGSSSSAGLEAGTLTCDVLLLHFRAELFGDDAQSVARQPEDGVPAARSAASASSGADCSGFLERHNDGLDLADQSSVI